ncbi:M48 family metallopeptidase [Egbenema bharatensis]|uniref:M48 family metallopeptidase n=1 Tax=Egbenema bharatensis TaxID=3463334 RepID=UPI003A87C2B7
MAKAKSSHTKPYRVRESTRAKHVSIKVSHLGEVEVVIPQGFDRRKIPEILERRKDWIAKTTQRIAAERQLMAVKTPEPAQKLPSHLELRSIAQTWSVKYYQGGGNQLIANVSGTNQLAVHASLDQPQACYRVLRHWLMRKAEAELLPWLQQVSQEMNLPYHQAAVRGQKTIWASCSGKKNISLNYKLLFLPSYLVRYVFIHELCHTVHLNHSVQFWNLVAEKEPDYRLYDSELNKGWCYIPEWVERSID